MTNTMMNATCDHDDVRALEDVELELVSGGFGFWDAVSVAAGAITTGAVKAYAAAITDTGI